MKTIKVVRLFLFFLPDLIWNGTYTEDVTIGVVWFGKLTLA